MSGVTYHKACGDCFNPILPKGSEGRCSCGDRIHTDPGETRPATTAGGRAAQLRQPHGGSEMSTPFIVIGRPRVTPTMLFPPGTTYKAAKAAFEADNPDFCFGDVFEALDDGDGEGPYEGDEGGFCEMCGRFMLFEDSHGDGDVSWCGECERKRLEAEG